MNKHAKEKTRRPAQGCNLDFMFGINSVFTAHFGRNLSVLCAKCQLPFLFYWVLLLFYGAILPVLSQTLLAGSGVERGRETHPADDYARGGVITDRYTNDCQ